MDWFGIKARAARRRTATRRATEDRQADRVTRGLAHQAREDQVRRHRPEADAPDSYYGGGLYPHSSASGMTVDNTQASWAQPDTSHHSHSSAHDSLGAAGSGLGFSSNDYGSSSSGDSGSSYDSGSSSGSDSSSSSSDSGGY